MEIGCESATLLAHANEHGKDRLDTVSHHLNGPTEIGMKDILCCKRAAADSLFVLCSAINLD